MDFLPEDIDEYIERERAVSRVVDSASGEGVAEALDAIQQWTVYAANLLVKAGLEPLEVISGLTGAVAAELADWHAAQGSDGEARDG